MTDKKKDNAKIKDSFSILIPVFNEEEILESSTTDIVRQLEGIKKDYELLLCENGSKDKTIEIAGKLKKKYKPVDYVSIDEPNYGKALQKGIASAKYEKVVVFEIDFYNLDFLRDSIVLLDEYDMVVGSKRAPGAHDKRPWIRRFITWGFNTALKILLGFKGTDTHGLKALKRSKLLDIVMACRVFNNLFATEFVIRAEKAGLKIKELPADVEELRDARVGVLARVPKALKNLLKLVYVIRFKK